MAVTVEQQRTPQQLTTPTPLTLPGFVPTKFSAALLSTPEMAQQAANKTLLGRLGTPEDIANVVAFVASDDASWVTAEIITVAGGMLASRL